LRPPGSATYRLALAKRFPGPANRRGAIERVVNRYGLKTNLVETDLQFLGKSIAREVYVPWPISTLDRTSVTRSLRLIRMKAFGAKSFAAVLAAERARSRQTEPKQQTAADNTYF
jgi:hypothetical protein